MMVSFLVVLSIFLLTGCGGSGPVVLESDSLRVELVEATGMWALVDKDSGQRWPSEGFAAVGEAPQLTAPFSLEGKSKSELRLKSGQGGSVTFALSDGGKVAELSYEEVGDEAIQVLGDHLTITEKEDGYVIVPCREGLLVPVKGNKAFKRTFGSSDYEGTHMSMLGLVKAGSGLILTWDDHYTFPELERKVEGEETLSTTVELRRSARSLRLRPTGKSDWNKIAKVYREVAEQKGYAVTLKEKIAREPTTEKLIGASNVKLWHLLRRKQDEESTKVLEERIRWTFDEAAQIAERLHHRLGINDCLFIIGGWINGGYDVRHPDILPANPECGGNKGLADALARIEKVGFISSLHDNYQDMYLDAPSYDPSFSQKQADGSIKRGGHWLGGVPDIVCSTKQLELAQRPQNLPEVLKLFSPQCYFIDTTFAAGLQECYDPDHPLDRNSDMREKSRLVEYARDLFGTFGSECGREWAIPHSEVFEGLSGVRGSYFHRESLLDDLDADAIPFWEMVYHDCQIVYGKYDCRVKWASESVTQHVLCARPFFYHHLPDHLYWDDPKNDRGFTPEATPFARSDSGWAEGLHNLDAFIKNTHEVLAPLHRVTAHDRLTQLEYLTPDGRVRSAVYGDKTKVVVNFGGQDAVYNSEYGGEVVLPQWGFVVESPTFAAFHAKQWGGQDYDQGALFTLTASGGDSLTTTPSIKVFHGFGPTSLKWQGHVYEVKREAEIGPL
jgi:hypothetical protein